MKKFNFNESELKSFNEAFSSITFPLKTKIHKYSGDDYFEITDFFNLNSLLVIEFQSFHDIPKFFISIHKNDSNLFKIFVSSKRKSNDFFSSVKNIEDCPNMIYIIMTKYISQYSKESLNLLKVSNSLGEF